MNRAAIFHRQTREFIYPQSREDLHVRFYAEKRDIMSAGIVYWKRNTSRMYEVSLKRGCTGFYREEFYADIHFFEPAHYIKYYFVVVDSEGTKAYLANKGVQGVFRDGDEFNFLCTGRRDYVTVPGWACGAVWYQIFPDRFYRGDNAQTDDCLVPWATVPEGPDERFGGTLRGITDRIDYLSSLGINVVYLNPVFKAEFNHKYATTDYLQIDPDFGTCEDFRRLVTSLHSRGIRIVLDGVFNHTGRSFFAFRDLKEKGENSRYKDWFYPHSFPLSENPLNYECVGDYAPMPKLDTSNEEVQTYIIGVMLHWLREYGIDGWRLDVADEVASSLWVRARNTIKAEFPDALLLGETWGDGYSLAGDGLLLDGVMNYLFRDAVISFCQGKSSVDFFLCALGEMYLKYPDQVNRVNLNLLDSHDTERIFTVLGEDRSMLRCAAALAFFLPGSPCIYYGDEAGLTGGNDPDCRRGMLWGEDQDRGLLAFFKDMVSFRKSGPGLSNCRMEVLYKSDEKRSFVLRNGDFILAMNASVSVQSLSLPYLESFEAVLPSDRRKEDYCTTTSLKLDAKSFVIFKRRMMK